MSENPSEDTPVSHADAAPGAHEPDRRATGAVRAIVFLYREFERACRDEGISIPQYRLLLFLRHGPKRAGELAARAAIQRPTLTSLVDGLEKDKRIRRVQVEADRRGVRLELTETGVRDMRSVEARLAGLLEGLCEGGDKEEILDAFAKMARILDGEVEKRLQGPSPGEEAS
jgi:DNA-binding MarR family transcriptional regulator